MESGQAVSAGHCCPWPARRGELQKEPGEYWVMHDTQKGILRSQEWLGVRGAPGKLGGGRWKGYLGLSDCRGHVWWREGCSDPAAVELQG